MENIGELFLEYQDDNEGLTPQDWISQYCLNSEELEYFFLLFK